MSKPPDVRESKPPVGKLQEVRDEQTTIIRDVPVQGAVAAKKKPFVMEQIEGPGSPRNFVLELEETIVGRSLQANIAVDSGSISRQHMALRKAGPEYSCTDLDSSNGVFLNGVRTHSAVLRDGDTIQIGDVVFVFHEGS